MASGLAFGFLVTYLLGSKWKVGRFANSFLVALIATGWFVLFRVGQVLELRAGDDPIGNRSSALAEISTHWQTVNTGYVTASSLSMLVLAWSFLSPRLTSRRTRFIAVGVASLVVGWTSYAFAVAFAASFLLIALGIRLTEKTGFVRQLAFSSLSILTGVATTFFFPGARARTGADVRGSIDVILEAIRNAPSGLGEWALDLASAPTLFALFFGIAISSVGVLRTPLRKSSHLAWIVGLLLLVSLFIYIVNEMTGVLIYGRALWQYMPGRLMIFVAGVICGILLVKRVDATKSFSIETVRALSVLRALVTVGVIVLSFLGSAVLATSIDTRQVAWEQGPSEVRGLPAMVDRGTPWVDECWRVLDGGEWTGQLMGYGSSQ